MFSSALSILLQLLMRKSSNLSVERWVPVRWVNAVMSETIWSVLCMYGLYNADKYAADLCLCSSSMRPLEALQRPLCQLCLHLMNSEERDESDVTDLRHDYWRHHTTPACWPCLCLRHLTIIKWSPALVFSHGHHWVKHNLSRQWHLFVVCENKITMLLKNPGDESKSQSC